LQELDQHAASGARMQEGDSCAVGAGPRDGIDGAISACDCVGEGGFHILHTVAQVVEAWTPPLEESGDGRVGTERSQELHAARSRADEYDLDTLALNGLAPLRVGRHERREEGDGFVQGMDGNADVVEHAFVHDRW